MIAHTGQKNLGGRIQKDFVQEQKGEPMTREEAKKILKRIVNTSNELTHPVMLNTEMGAIKVAIEALSDVPDTNVGDMISKSAVLDILYLDPGIEEIREKMIKNLPSAEPEIIRCGECKYAEVADKEDTQDGYTCQFHRGSIWFSGSYCSWAERRNDEEADIS